MYRGHTTPYVRIALSLLMLVCLFSGRAKAQEATSTDFMTLNSTLNTFGGVANSASFSAVQSADQIGGGESTSTNFTLQSGFLYYQSLDLRQQHWRWYDDEENETPTSPFAGENVAPSNVALSNVVKLRVSVAEVGGVDAPNLKFRLQFATSSDFSGSVNNVAEIADCTETSAWCYANGAGADGEVITTKTLSDAGACTSGVGVGCGTHNESGTTTSTLTQQKDTTTEYEFTVQESGTAANTAYFFRLFDTTSSTTIPYNAGQAYPSLSTAGGTLSFSIDGLPSATTTSGITTTIDTTSTSVPFGSLSVGSTALGAQRLTVSTNATQGYEVFTYAEQDLLGSGDEIPPVNATNQSPAGWTAGCSSLAYGCYGYHTSEAVLSGGSTRFAPDDTYAQFSTTTLNEVAYSAAPVTDRSTDMVYKVEVHDQQTADDYSTNVVYIVVPTF